MFIYVPSPNCPDFFSCIILAHSLVTFFLPNRILMHQKALKEGRGGKGVLSDCVGLVHVYLKKKKTKGK